VSYRFLTRWFDDYIAPGIATLRYRSRQAHEKLAELEGRFARLENREKSMQVLLDRIERFEQREKSQAGASVGFEQPISLCRPPGAHDRRAADCRR
jgi:hypothetical protein